MRITLRLIPVLFLLFAGCSLPRIIILHDPLSASEHESLGKAYESRNENELALQQYQEAINCDPKRASSYLLLGDLSFKLRKFPDTERAYEKAATLQPDNGDIDNNLCWVYLEQRIRLKKCLQLIDGALLKTPEHSAYFLDTRGVILLRMGNIDASVKDLREALSLLPADETKFREEVIRHLEEASRAAGENSRDERTRIAPVHD